MLYNTYSLSNGLRLVHLPCESPVAYCGFAINVGSRDEDQDSFGMAHFVEHMLFKGTKKRRSTHILNRMETVGGELNAYTTKEETFIYSVFLEPHFERAFELLSDLVFHSSFPEQETKKELEVILDEINSYEDNPAELIYDEFENLLYEGQQLGHHILGTPESINRFTHKQGLDFVRQHYLSDNIVFFSMGKTPFKKIVRLAEAFIGKEPQKPHIQHRLQPACIAAKRIGCTKNTNQAHVMIGGRAYNLQDKRRVGLHLINNILGGPGMNSRLNISLREKRGLVYQIDSSITSYSDTGIFSIYFGSEKQEAERCIQLTLKELKKFRDKALTTLQLARAKKQLIGQLGVATDHRESTFLRLGKSFLHHNHFDSLPDICAQIESLSSGCLWDICNEVFDEGGISLLKYE